MSSLDFNPSISLKNIEDQVLKPKMLVSPCNHMIDTEVVVQILTSTSTKKECTHCKTEIKEYRTIDMADFAVKVKNEISKVQEFVAKQSKEFSDFKEFASKQTSEFNSKLETLQSQQQELTTQLSQKESAISELTQRASTSESKLQEVEGTNQKLSSELSNKQQEIQSNSSKIQELGSSNQQLLSTQTNNLSLIETLKQQLLEMNKKLESLQEEKMNSNASSQSSKQEVESQQQVHNQQVEEKATSTALQVKLNYKLPDGYQLGYRGAPDWNRPCVAEFYDGAHHFISLQLNSPFKFVLIKDWNDFIEWEQLSGDRIVKDPQETPNFQPIFPSLKKSETLQQQLSEMNTKLESLHQETMNSNDPSQNSKQEVESNPEVHNQQEENKVRYTSYFPVKLANELPQGYFLGIRTALDWNDTKIAECSDNVHAFRQLPLNTDFKFVLLKGWSENDLVEWEQLNGNRSLEDPQYRGTFNVVFSSLKK